MARDLSERDREIQRKLILEFEDHLKEGIDLEYLNILPPVANHHSKDARDFEMRLKRLSSDDMRYVTDMIFNGSESLGCLLPEFAEALFTVAGQKLSSEVADRLREAYESDEGCSG